MDFPAAVETLAKAAGMEVPREESSPRAEAAQRRRLDIYSELEKASAFYRAELRKHSPAIEYLKARGLTGQIAREFALGYAPNEWDSLITLCTDNQQALQLMIDGGMLIKRDQDQQKNNQRSHYDRFRDRIMFPIRDQRGRTIAFGGRVLGDQKPKYLNSPETSVFHKSRELYGLYESLQQRQKPEELIVVEGYMDVVALAQYDVRNAVATLGTSVGSAHMERIFRHVSNVVFCFDGDSAGRSAAQRALDACLPAMLDGRQARFLFLPEGEDPDTIVRTEGKEGFNRRVASSKTLSDFVFELASTDLDLSKPDQRALFAHKALPYLNQLPKGLLQSILLQRLAEETGIGKQELSEINTPDAPKKAPPPQHETDVTTESAPELTQDDESDQTGIEQQQLSGNFKSILAWILRLPKLANHEMITEDFLDREDPENIIGDIRRYLETNPHAEFYNIHAYFFGGKNPQLASFLLDMVGPKSITDELSNEQIETEFSDQLEGLSQQTSLSKIEQRLRHINTIPTDEITAELRKESRELLAELKTLKKHIKKS